MKHNHFKYKLFGRSKGRKKNDKLFLEHIKKYKFNIDLDLNTKNYNILDIGSGNGENAIFLSKNKIDSKIVACDLFEDGNMNLCKKIVDNKIQNISLYSGNVLELLDNLKINKIFNEVWILFPDPWPKTRHHKRRLINQSFFQFIYGFLKKSGYLMIATDSESYLQSILISISEVQKKFFWENHRFELWDYKNLDLPLTKFYKKSLESNRNSMFLKLKKI